jgi:1-acyl-sn-glycerol-3-phosphate acyltransferase
MFVQVLYAAAFVTKIEARKISLIGAVCDSLQCIYVDREQRLGAQNKNGSTTASTAAKLAARVTEKALNPLARMRPLCVFPEVGPRVSNWYQC